MLGDRAARFTPPPENGVRGAESDGVSGVGASGSRVDVTLRVINIGKSRYRTRALGADGDGGRAASKSSPCRPRRTTPATPQSEIARRLRPNQELILWPFFDFADTLRRTFGSRYLFLRQNVNQGPDQDRSWPTAWAGWRISTPACCSSNGLTTGQRRLPRSVARANQTFLQRRHAGDGDGGENCDARARRDAELVEAWELFGNVPPVLTEADVDRIILAAYQMVTR